MIKKSIFGLFVVLYMGKNENITEHLRHKKFQNYQLIRAEYISLCALYRQI